MQGLGIISRKKTRAPRGSGARDTYELKYDLIYSVLTLVLLCMVLVVS